MKKATLYKILSRIQDCLKDDSVDLNQLEVLGKLYKRVRGWR